MSPSIFMTGFSMGLSLIVAIGAQNAFVLRQGLKREHVLPVVLTCALSDAVLIVFGGRRRYCRGSNRSCDMAGRRF